MPLRLHNTLTKRLEEFVPLDPDGAHVTFYTCGPTVYDDAHIGNFRSFLSADVLRRFIESGLCVVRASDGGERRGPRRVTHVMNITDVGHMTDDAEGGENGEDRMAVAGRRLEEAKKAGTLPKGVDVDPRDPYAIARFYEGRFKEDARALGLKLALEAERDATLMPRATETVGAMLAVIERLVELGHAYMAGQAPSRAVYFDVRSFPEYGRLSGNTLDALKAGEGGRVSEANQAQKKNPGDFLLWKEDHAHVMKWESRFGAGYPGWHIECTAMSVMRLAPQEIGRESGQVGGGAAGASGASLIDLHSGGEDNIFPHHECEIAQSACCYSGGRGSFASMWFHPRFLLVEGTKMSKSKGNFFTARDLFARGVEPAALRLELIRTHYRANANFTMQGLEDSARMVGRWRKVAEAHAAGPDEAALRARVHAEHPICAAFAAAMHDDLNVAQGIGAINAWLNGLGAPTAEDSAAMRAIDEVLGVLGLARGQTRETEIGVFAAGVAPDPDLEALLRERRDARARKDFATSDRIRDEFTRRGLAIKDMVGGRVEVRRA